MPRKRAALKGPREVRPPVPEAPVPEAPEAPSAPEVIVETTASKSFRESVKKALKKQWDDPGRPM